MGNNGMQVTSQQYYYNSVKNKLSLEDGSEDLFCLYFNDCKGFNDGVITKTDVENKQDILDTISDIKSNNTNYLNSKEIWKLEMNNLDPFRSEISVDDFKMYFNKCLGDVKEFKSDSEYLESNYIYLHDGGYDKQNNSISLVPGKKFNTEKFQISIEENKVKITDKKNNDMMSKEDGYKISDIIDLFIRSANDQMVIGEISSENMMGDIIDVLKELGIDTDKNFTVNQREFIVKENRIFAIDESANPLSFLGLTKSQLESAFKKYESSYVFK